MLMRRIHRAWLVLAGTLAVLVLMAGFRSVVGVLLDPLREEFGWSTAAISLAASVNLMIYGLGGPFAAALYDRFGLRRCVLIAIAVVALGSALTLQMSAQWQFVLLWGVLNGTATGAVSVTLAAVIATRWFVARRGLATGILTAANATGQLVFLPLLAWLTSAYGWRYAVGAVVAVATVIVLPLATLLVRDRPAAVGLRAYGATEDDPPPPPRDTNPFLRAIGDGLVFAAGSKVFWQLSATFFICGATTYGLIGTHLIPAAVDHGITEVAAAGLLATIGVFDLVGTLASGYLTDRFDPRVLLAWYYGLRGLSLLALPVVIEAHGPGLLAFVVFYGLDWVATVPPTVAITAEVFGRERVGLVFGWIFAAHQLGGGAAAFGAGLSQTFLGTYTPAFLTAAALGLVASAISLRIRPPAGLALA
ncbi:MAG: MFS transporter [Gaiellales bacterium]